MEPTNVTHASSSERSAPPRLRDCGMLKLPMIEAAVVFLLVIAAVADMTSTDEFAGFGAVFMFIPAIILIALFWLVSIPLLRITIDNFKWDIFLAVLIVDVALVCVLVETMWFLLTPCALLVVVSVMVRRFIALRKWKKGEPFEEFPGPHTAG